MKLPAFPYHPHPIATGSVVKSDAACCCCGRVRGAVYVGPVYAVGEYEDCICPWCIADGSAHENLGATFTEEDAIGGYGAWETVPGDVIEEVAYRTPGFMGWQQERWWTHCGDAAQFLRYVGREELQDLGQDAVAAFQESACRDGGPEWEMVFADLDKDDSPTGYLFRCRRCGKLGGYFDFD